MSYDVVVAGGGPVGVVAAIAFARKGARVAVLEANPGHHRLAGELLHPAGVRVLRDLGIELPAQPVRGFAVFSPDLPEPAALGYTGDTGLTFEFNDMLARLREVAAAEPGVTWLPEHQVVAIDGQRVGWRAAGGTTGTLEADLVVGADGKFSRVRELLGLERERHVLSHMAGLLLHGVELPFEGYGHVVLSAVGPALIYRIGDDAVRVCLDVPKAWKADPRRVDLLMGAYGPVLPEALREPIRAALSSGIQWAINQLAPRLSYGRPGVALVGDAVGHFHPMTAVGLSLGFNDAAALARAGSFEAYAAERSREGLAPALLATALYEIFALDSEPTAACRRAVFDLWRSEAMRRQTMDFLSLADTRVWRMVAVGVPIGALAAAHVARMAASERRVRSAFDSARRIAGLVQWLTFESVPESMQFLPRPVSPFEPVRARIADSR